MVLGLNLKLILVQDAVEVGSKVRLVSGWPDISTAMCQITTAGELGINGVLIQVNTGELIPRVSINRIFSKRNRLNWLEVAFKWAA